MNGPYSLTPPMGNGAPGEASDEGQKQEPRQRPTTMPVIEAFGVAKSRTRVQVLLDRRHPQTRTPAHLLILVLPASAEG
jgi:hypothetical protein